MAKLKLADLLKEEHHKQEHNKTASEGKLTFGEAWKIYKERMESDPNVKSATKKYQQEILVALYKSWSELEKLELRKITKTECLDWKTRFSKGYAATRVNGAISLLRRIIEMGVESGIRYNNPAKFNSRAKVRQKQLRLPEPSQFERFVTTIQTGGGGTSRDCADLVRFLAFGGGEKAKLQILPGKIVILPRAKLSFVAIQKLAPKTGLCAGCR